MTTQPSHLSYEGHVPQWTLADRLTKSLRESTFSVQSIADALEVSRDTVSRWMHGKTKPTHAMLYGWAVLTGTDLEWLRTGSTVTRDEVVRHQGLEPRTRWYEGKSSDLHVLAPVIPLRRAS